MAIYSNVTGADIQDFDEDIWNETFGIFGTSELQKIRFNLSQAMKEKMVSQELFGWGKNHFGEIGFSTISIGNSIPHPKLIPLPEEIENLSDAIVDIKCGVKHSVILTKSGQVWAVGNLKENKSMQLQKLKAKFEEESKDQNESKKSNKE